MLSTTTPADGRSKVAFLFYVEATQSDQSKASKVLSRLLTVASSCPAALVQQMSSSSIMSTSASDSSSSCFALQTEGEIFAWKCSWECISVLANAIGIKETRIFLQKRSDDIARSKALRQGAAVMVAYLKNELKSDSIKYKMMMKVVKDFVENVGGK